MFILIHQRQSMRRWAVLLARVVGWKAAAVLLKRVPYRWVAE
jgi:hypothetical protein